MQKIEKLCKTYYKELTALAIVLAVYLFMGIFWLMMRGEVCEDEFYSLRDVWGLFSTGQNLKWDFYLKSVTSEQLSSQLDFILLAKWMRLFGNSPLAMRSLSTVYGVAAVASFFFCIYKLSRNLTYTFWSTLVLSVNLDLIEMSAFIRGYTLLLLLNVWIFYWAYRALNTDKIRNIFGYGLVVLALSYLACWVRTFELLYLTGIALYIIIKAFLSREKKYIVMALLIVLGIGAIIVACNFPADFNIPLYRFVVNQLKEYANIGWNQPEYIKDMLDVFLFYPITIAGIVLAIGCILKRNSVTKEQKDIMIYAGSLVCGTLFSFVCLMDWGHDSRYLLVIYPFMSLFVMGGFCFYTEAGNERRKGLVYGILLGCIGINIYGSIVQASNYTNERFAEAYKKMADYIVSEGMTVPVFIGFEMREYYARDIVGEHVWVSMVQRSDEDFTDHISDLSKIGAEYPQGIITIENRQGAGITKEFEQLLNSDALEQITGQAVDGNGVGGWAYYIENVREGKIEGDKTPIRFGYNYGGAVRTTEEEDKTIVELEINGSAPELTLLCIKVNQFSEGDGRQRYVQLVLEPNGQPLQYYRIELRNERKMDQSSIDETYYVYVNEKEPQMYTDCYTF